MVFLTKDEYEHTKLGSLDNRVYNRIERVFAAAMGFSVAERLMLRFADKTVRDISAQSFVDILSAVPVL